MIAPAVAMETVGPRILAVLIAVVVSMIDIARAVFDIVQDVEFRSVSSRRGRSSRRWFGDARVCGR